MSVLSRKIYVCIVFLGLNFAFGQSSFDLHSNLRLKGGGITLSNQKHRYNNSCDQKGTFAIDSVTNNPIYCNDNNTWDLLTLGTQNNNGARGTVLQTEIFESKKYLTNTNTSYVNLDTVTISPISANSSIIIEASLSSVLQYSGTVTYGIFTLNDDLLTEASHQSKRGEEIEWVQPLTTLIAKDNSPVIDGNGETKYVIKVKTTGAQYYYNHYNPSYGPGYLNAKSYFKLTEITTDGTYFKQNGDTIISSEAHTGNIAFQAIDNSLGHDGTSSGNRINFPVTSYNNGGHFDGSFFNIPKAGPYQFCWGGIAVYPLGTNEPSVARYFLTVNDKGVETDGTISSNTVAQHITANTHSELVYVAPHSYHGEVHNDYGCHIINLNVEDKIAVYYYNDHARQDYAEGFTRFSGHYLGPQTVVSHYHYTNGEGAENLIINGGMKVAQRGTSSTASGYGSVDRWRVLTTSGTTTHTQGNLTSSQGEPFNNGFRKHLRATYTTSGSSDEVVIEQLIEAQDVAASGWIYSDASSVVTLSFWARASVSSDNYKAVIRVPNSNKVYVQKFSLNGGTDWTKVALQFPGDGSLEIPDDNSVGVRVQIYPDHSSSGGAVAEGAWTTNTNTSAVGFSTAGTGWMSSTGRTFDLTGVQLEVGPTASPFEKRKYAEELRLCQRYYQKIGPPAGKHRDFIANTVNTGGDVSFFYVPTIVQLRMENPLIQWVPATSNPVTIYYGGHSSANAENGIAIDGNNNINITNTPNIVDGGTSIGATLRITHYTTDLGQSSPVLRIRNQSYFEFDAELKESDF